MTIYDELQGVARDVLTEFKQGVVNYIKITPGNGPVDNPGQPVKTSYGINGSVTGVSQTYVAKGLAVASDLQVITPVDPLYVPDIKGSIEVDGIMYKIVRVIAKPAAGTPVVYVIIFQKGGGG